MSCVVFPTMLFSFLSTGEEVAAYSLTILHTGQTFAQVLPVDSFNGACAPNQQQACTGLCYLLCSCSLLSFFVQNFRLAHMGLAFFLISSDSTSNRWSFQKGHICEQHKGI